jgi:HSP20 family protein
MLARQTDGAQPVNRLRNEMDQLLENFFGPMAAWGPFAGSPRTFPPLNIWEDEESLYAEAELPGMTMDGVDVFVIGNELTIKGERKSREENGYHRRERPVGSFVRSITLPVAIDPDRVEATLKDGVLLITMPKSQAAKPRKITVKAA